MPRKKNPVAAETTVPLNEWLVTAMDAVKISNKDLAAQTGYDSPNVIAMLRSGNMAFPVNKVNMFAKALKVDKIELLYRVLASRNPELLEMLQETVGDRLVTDAEMEMLTFQRELLKGSVLEIMKHPEYLNAVSPILKSIADQNEATHQAALAAIKAAYVPGRNSDNMVRNAKTKAEVHGGPLKKTA